VGDVLPIRPAATDPTPAATIAPDALLVDAAGLAQLLAVSLRTVRTWDAGEKLPAPVRIGGAVRWSMGELRAWIAAGCPDRATWTARRDAARK
jgi:predicted DNA-binding transcriptional regulator AlpA